jgi:hypothetical protein
MFSLVHKKNRKKEAGEKGQALILVLVLLTLASLFIPALLGFIGTGTKTGQVYDKKAAELYAADAGIQDAVWQIRSKNIETFTGFSRYDFGATGWSYSIPPVNSEPVNVTIRNVWIPSNITPAPNESTARDIITTGKLIVAGNTIMPGVTADDGTTKLFKYEIKIAYTPDTGENLTIDSIGLWLPPGFNYFTDTGHFAYVTIGATDYSLETLPVAFSAYVSTLAEVPWAGNKTWVWSFDTTPLFSGFPGIAGTITKTITISLYFEPPQDRPTLKPDAVAWIKTGNGTAYGIPYSWDANSTIYKSTAVAKKPLDVGTTIDSYMAHSELPQLQTAQAGDYVAIGKTLMLGVSPTSNQRELLLSDSTNTVDSVPNGATVDLAYLYWAGWLKQPLVGLAPSVGVFWDNGNNLNNWTAGSSWTSTGTLPFNGRFEGHYSSGGDPAKYLTLASPVDLTSITSATIQWKQEVVPAPTPITFRAAGANATGTTSVTCNRPAGTATNDVLIAFIIDQSTTNAQSTAPTGWQARGYAYTSGRRFQVFTAVVGKNSLAGTSWSFTGLTSRAQGMIIGYYNADTTGYGGLDTTVSVRNNASGTYGTSGITTVTDGSMVIAAFGSYVAASTYTWASESCATLGSLTERFDNKNSTYCSIAVADKLMTIAGVTGASTATPTSGQNNGGILLALKPASSYTLRLSISNDGGSSYNEVGSYPSTGSYSYNLTSGYFNPNFKMRFYLDGFDGTGEYVYLDNIGIMVTSAEITAKPADAIVTFTINNGTPHPITAALNDPAQSQSQVKDGPPSAEPLDGYYYGCRVDVTDLVKQESNGADLSATPDPIFGNGNGEYKVAGVYADSLKADGTTYGSASFAGWSLVIIYSSPDTLGHQLYLYDLKDTFQSVPATVPDSPPMQITGFIVPAQVAAETEVAKMTFFVGEGDIQISGDYIALVDQHDITEHLMWDGVDLPSNGNTEGSPRNVWNGRSTGSTSSEAGVDIDTFHILWSQNQLRVGDTSAQINLHTYGDGYVTIYKILSFRSKITTGGSIGYLIR